MNGYYTVKEFAQKYNKDTGNIRSIVPIIIVIKKRFLPRRFQSKKWFLCKSAEKGSIIQKAASVNAFLAFDEQRTSKIVWL